MRLTKTVVEGAQYRGRGRKAHDIRWDDTQPGFGLRVYPSGTKAFVVAYRVHGRKRIVSLGRFGELTKEGPLTVQRARALAQKVIVAAREDEDLLEKAPADVTVANLAERYLEEHAIPKKRPRSVKDDRSLLNQIIVPELGDRRVEGLTRKDVARLHHALRKTPVRANRALALLSKMMSLAEGWGLRPDKSNPCRHVERYPEKKRRRFLSTAELTRLGETLAEVEAAGTEPLSAIAAIRLLILTGCRRQEILGLRWDQVDFERKMLRLDESKTGPKTVPLGAATLELLAGLPRTEGNSYVIVGKRPGAHFVGIAKVWDRIKAKAGLKDVRLHDLRHSFAAVAAGGGETLLVIAAILGHNQIATTERYAHLAADPVHQAADRITAEIAAALEGKPPGKVRPIDR